jgi:hypothetical protein
VRYHGETALDDDEDIEARGGGGDVRNLRCKLGIICGDDDAKKRALRARAWDAATSFVENYWGSIVEIAGELLRRRRLFDRDVRECVRRVGDHILLREQPSAVMPATPTRAFRSTRLWGSELRDAGGGAVYVIGRDGRRAVYDNVTDAVHAAAARLGA